MCQHISSRPSCVHAGSAAVPQPLINLSAVTAGANAALDRQLCCPPFSYAANDLAGLVTAFLFEDVGVTAYNGAAPLISDKTFLSDAISIGLIEAYHAGIVRHHPPQPALLPYSCCALFSTSACIQINVDLVTECILQHQ